MSVYFRHVNSSNKNSVILSKNTKQTKPIILAKFAMIVAVQGSTHNIYILPVMLFFLFSSKLVVNLLKADELPEAKDDYPRVYVTVNLLHNTNVNTPNQELKSNVQQGTYSPNFNERLEFDVSSMTVQETSLRFIVWYVDSFSQGECLGMVGHNLDQLTDQEIISNKETIICKDIQRISRVRV